MCGKNWKQYGKKKYFKKAIFFVKNYFVTGEFLTFWHSESSLRRHVTLIHKILVEIAVGSKTII